MLDAIGRRADPTSDERLHEAADLGLAKGEVLIAHLVGSGEQARVVAVERYAPRD
jgi:8-oxo-dGTP diphosphatase